MSNCDIESLVVSIFGGNREGGGVPPFLGKLNKNLLPTPTPTLPAIQSRPSTTDVAKYNKYKDTNTLIEQKPALS